MKKLFTLLCIAVVAMGLMTSCSKDKIVLGNYNFTFTNHNGETIHWDYDLDVENNAVYSSECFKYSEGRIQGDFEGINRQDNEHLYLTFPARLGVSTNTTSWNEEIGLYPIEDYPTIKFKDQQGTTWSTKTISCRVTKIDLESGNISLTVMAELYDRDEYSETPIEYMHVGNFVGEFNDIRLYDVFPGDLDL